MILIFLGGVMLLALAGGLLLLTPRVTADAAAIDAANALVANGRAAEAARIYEGLIAAGVNDSAVYYNLGNAYFQQGATPQAIAAYRRAAELAPRDADIRANLETALVAAPESAALVPGGPAAVLAGLTGRLLSPDETAALALALWFGLAFLLLLWWWAMRNRAGTAAPRRIGRLAFVVGLLLLVVGLSLAGRVYLGRSPLDGLGIGDVAASLAAVAVRLTTV